MGLHLTQFLGIRRYDPSRSTHSLPSTSASAAFSLSSLPCNHFAANGGAFSLLEQMEKTFDGIFSSCVLWPVRFRYACDPQNTKTAEDDLNWYERWVGPMLATVASGYLLCRVRLKFGKLAMSVEGGGKGRIFAIGNYYVKQRLLRPYHDWAMEVLRRAAYHLMGLLIQRLL
jgi:hypothetical protein